MKLALVTLFLLVPSSAFAWSAIGHEIVAAIAQAHLTPKTVESVAGILPEYADGHLQPVAAWADAIKFRRRETSVLHYINALGDDPAGKCRFGEEGWVDGERNLLKAIGNYTLRLQKGLESEEALKFLVHFVGDLHQPLHLAGKLRGGNQAIVKFEGRRASLHSAWDGLFIQKSIRELGNYTTPLPSKQIEKALTGKFYDPYVRFIIWEGIRGMWRSESLNWPACPQYSQVRLPLEERAKNLPRGGLNQYIGGPEVEEADRLEKYHARWEAVRLEEETKMAAEAEKNKATGEEEKQPALFNKARPNDGYEALIEETTKLMAPLKKEQHKIKLAGEPSPLPLLLSMMGIPNSWIAKLPLKWLVSPPKFIGAFPDEQEKAGIVPGCPWYWADSMHDINCEVVWPKQFVDGMELDTPAYWGKVRGGLVVEKQLAMGGIRLAAVLNSIFDPDFEKGAEVSEW